MRDEEGPLANSDDALGRRAASSVYHTRRYAREVALKASYAMELKECLLEEVISDPLVTDSLPCPPYARIILRTMIDHRDLLDERIREKVQRWEFHRLAIVDKCILRLSAAELFFIPEVPPKVVINEAIELAKKFSTDQSWRFINGILDALYQDLRSGRWVIPEDSTTPR